MRTSEALDAIAPALAKAQGAMKSATKDSVNPHFRSKYADLASIWDACRSPLSTNGLCALQEVTGDEKTILVTTRLQHASGQWMEFGPFPVPVAKHDAHGVGSATSYGKRYGLSAALGIVSDDDDGNAATGKTEPKAETIKPTAGAFDKFDAEEQMTIRLESSVIEKAFAAGKEDEMMRLYIKSRSDDADRNVASWSLLSAPCRRRIKEIGVSTKPAAATT